MFYKPETVALRYFVVTPYEMDGKGNLVPQLPSVCPCSVECNDACRVFLDHQRPRKTGPGFPLYVMRCRIHGVVFTLYPPGYTPWGRQKWAPVAPDGALLSSEKDASPFRNTYFEAALDLAENIIWVNEKEWDTGYDKPSFITQLCHLQRSVELLGLNQNPSQQEVFAETLGVPGQQLHEATLTIERQLSITSLGRSVYNVLSAISPMMKSVFERLAACGAAVGLWPPIHVWHPQLNQLRLKSFFHTKQEVEMLPA